MWWERLPVCTTDALKASAAQMHYGNAFNPCALFKQVILNFIPQWEKPATRRANSYAEPLCICCVILTVTQTTFC